MFDSNTDISYTQNQVEEIAKQCAKHAVEQVFQQLNLGNGIPQNMIAADEGASNMASNHKERYYYVVNNEMKNVVLYGKDKKDTDVKFKAFIENQCSAPLLSDFIKNKYRASCMRKLAPTTVVNYNTYLDLYIIPFLGKKKMDLITVSDIQDFYDWMAEKKHLVHDTISRVSGLLSRIYRIAIDMKVVTDNPIKKTLLSNEGKPSKHHTALATEEVKRIKKDIPKLEDEQQRLYMGLLAYTGMRREEILGLGWEHLNFDERYGSVQRTVTYPDNKIAVVREKTKTKTSARDFIITDALYDILKPCAKESGFIIHGRKVTDPISASSLRRLYRKAFATLGIKGHNNHDWRTTFGTQLKESGLTATQVADLLGHADTRMVEKVYAPTRHESIMIHKDRINMLNK